MDERPRPIAKLDDEDETADAAAMSGPLGALVEREVKSGTVESDDTRRDSTAAGPRSTASIEYAEGTTEHDDDAEG